MYCARALPAFLAGVLLLSGCAGRLAGEQDGAPAGGGAAVDNERMPDIVPRNEPLSPYGNPESYEVLGRTYHVMDAADGYVEEGMASWYGTKFHGKRTSSGEPYNMFAMTAAHKVLPLPTYVRVTNLENRRSVVVKVNDRGPFAHDRIIDLSYAAARRVDMHETGTARVRVETLSGGTPITDGSRQADDGGTGGGEPGGEAWIQLGAFSRFANAQRLRAQAAGADIRDVDVQRGRDSAGSRIYRVRIGPLEDAQRRDAVMNKLLRAGIDPGRVVVD